MLSVLLWKHLLNSALFHSPGPLSSLYPRTVQCVTAKFLNRIFLSQVREPPHSGGTRELIPHSALFTAHSVLSSCLPIAKAVV